MFNKPDLSERQPEAHPPHPRRPEDDEDAWERVLDCGAPGPAHAAPALFYQATLNYDSPSPGRCLCFRRQERGPGGEAMRNQRRKSA